MRRALGDRLRAAPWRPQVEAAIVVEQSSLFFHDHLTPELVALVTPVAWKGRTLVVVVRHPAAAQPVRALEGELQGWLHTKTGIRNMTLQVRVRTNDS